MLQIGLFFGSISIALLLIPVSLILFYVSRNKLGEAKNDILFRLSLPLILHLFALPCFSTVVLWDFLISKPFGNSSFFSMYGAIPDMASYYYLITSLGISFLISFLSFVFGVLFVFREQKQEYVKLILLSFLSVLVTYTIMFHRDFLDTFIFVANDEVDEINTPEAVIDNNPLVEHQTTDADNIQSYWLENNYLGNLHLSETQRHSEDKIDLIMDKPYDLTDSIVQDEKIFITATFDNDMYALMVDRTDHESRVIFSNRDHDTFQNAFIRGMDTSGTKIVFDLMSCIGCEASLLGKAVYNLETNDYWHLPDVALFEWNKTTGNGYRYKKIPDGCEYYFKSPFGRETKNQDCEFKLTGGQWFE